MTIQNIWQHTIKAGPVVTAIATVAIAIFAGFGLKKANQVYRVQALVEQAAKAEKQTTEFKQLAVRYKAEAKHTKAEYEKAQQALSDKEAELQEKEAVLKATQTALVKTIQELKQAEASALQTEAENAESEAVYGKRIWVYVAGQITKKLNARYPIPGYWDFGMATIAKAMEFQVESKGGFKAIPLASMGGVKYLFDPLKQRGDLAMRDKNLQQELDLFKPAQRNKFQQIIDTFINENSESLSRILVVNLEGKPTKNEIEKEVKRVKEANEKFRELVAELHEELLKGKPA